MTEIPLGLFLWRRIRQLGIESVFGVPGDFNLNFLDFIYDVPGLKWVGNANELNAAYAADGYGRMRGAPGCLVTTHGVGELSAINGIAGSMSEHVPIIHIVGQTPRAAQDNHKMIHHSIGTSPDHQVYNKTSQHVRCAAAELWDPKKAPAEIDRVLRECVVRKLPVYIFFPIDLTLEKVPESALDTPLDLSLSVNEAGEKEALSAITKALKEAQSAAIFVDFLTRSHGQTQAQKLVDTLPLPIYTSHMSKGVISETHHRYVGIYNGNISMPGVAEAMHAADLVLAIGWWPCDSNTASFGRDIPTEKRIDIMDTYVIVQGKRFDNVFMARILDQITASSKQLNLSPAQMPCLPAKTRRGEPPNGTRTNGTHTNGDTTSKITQEWIWSSKGLGKFLQPGDVVLADTGTASYGMPSCPFPEGATFISQTYYGSIGHATPCALGVDLALRERHAADPSTPRRRTVLVTGDGSIQLTIQEVGTMIARGLQPIIMIINNAGYTIERAIHGASCSYNDIAPYDYSYLLSLFGGESRSEAQITTTNNNKPRNFRRARTPQEFDAAWDDEGLRNPKEVQVFEVFMEQRDIPWQLARLLKNRIPGMEEYYEKEGFTYAESG